MLKYLLGDLFEHVPGDSTQTVFICHVCNDKGGWGSGFVVPLGQHYPQARADYLAWAQNADFDFPFEQGLTQFVEVRKDPLPLIYVSNMVAQTLGGPHPLNYDSLELCMKTVAKRVKEFDGRIAAPLFGAGLAGGSWPLIEKMVSNIWVAEGIEVDIYYLPQFLPKDWTPPAQ